MMRRRPAYGTVLAAHSRLAAREALRSAGRVQRRIDIVISRSLPLSAYLCISMYGHRCLYLYLYIYTCIYLYTYIYIYIYACVSTFYVFVCVCVFVRACVRACVCVCMCLCLSLDIDIFRSVHIYAYTPKRGGGVVCLCCVGPRRIAAPRRRFGLGCIAHI